MHRVPKHPGEHTIASWHSVAQYVPVSEISSPGAARLSRSLAVGPTQDASTVGTIANVVTRTADNSIHRTTRQHDTALASSSGHLYASK